MNISKIVIHCSATDNMNPKSVALFHTINCGWTAGGLATPQQPLAGYHAMIDDKGVVFRGIQGFCRPEDVNGAHTQGINNAALGVCCLGDLDKHPPTQLQLGALNMLCREWREKHNILSTEIFGHRNAEKHGGSPVHKTCPGKLFTDQMIEDAAGIIEEPSLLFSAFSYLYKFAVDDQTALRFLNIIRREFPDRI